MTQKERKEAERLLTFYNHESNRLIDTIRTKKGDIVENARRELVRVTGLKDGMTVLLDNLGYAVNWIEMAQGWREARIIKYR